MNLSGKVCMVTGATRGIGLATAKALASKGASVVVTGIQSDEEVNKAVAGLDADSQSGHLGLCYDVSESGSAKAAFQEVFKKYKRLDVLVNNAGVLDAALIGMIPEPSISRVLEVNVKGCITHLQSAARLMTRNHSGSIINISSIMGTHAHEGLAVYSSSKAALIGLTKAAAKELAPSGIRVNAIAPGYIETDMIKDMPEHNDKVYRSSIKMGRVGTPDDIAMAILFFASDYSRYVTGQVLGVDGGMII